MRRQGTQYTPVSAGAAGSPIQTAGSHPRQTSNLQSRLQHPLLPHGAAAPRSKIASPAPRLPLGGGQEGAVGLVEQAAALDMSPGSWSSAGEPEARGSNSWNQEALKPILSFPIHCGL